MELKRILVGTDFSECAGRALQYATELAKKSSAGLHVLHAPPVPTYVLMDVSYNPGPAAVTRILDQSQDLLDKAVAGIREQGIECKAVVKQGLAHATLRDYAEKNDVDLIVISTHGRRGFSKFIYGSVTERVLKTAKTPTLVVPASGEASWPSHIVVAFDFSEPSERAAQAVRAFHRVRPSAVHLVHSYLDVWGEYTDRGAVAGTPAEKRREALKLGLEELLEEEAKRLYSIDAHAVQTHLVAGDPAETVLAMTKELKADLICCGTSGKSGLEQALLGSVARRLLQQAEVPILFCH